MRTEETGLARGGLARGSWERGRMRRRVAAVEWALLAPPVLFWSIVFMAVAGVRPFEGVLAAVPEAAQDVVVLACPLVAVMLGAAAARRAGRGVREEGATPGRLAVAAGAALFAFAVLASLKHP